MSLPMAFGAQVATIIPLAGYAVSSHRWPAIAAQRARLDAIAGRALAAHRRCCRWAGHCSAHPPWIAERSLGAAQLAPLFALDQIRWIGLQRPAIPPSWPIRPARPRLTDWTTDLHGLRGYRRADAITSIW